MSDFFHIQQKAMQKLMGTESIAERIAQTRCHQFFNATDLEIICGASYFFMASTSPAGKPDVSIKAGPAGFVHIEGDSRLIFPDYDGNGMFRSLGNIQATNFVALLFVEFWAEKRKLRIHGRAKVTRESGLVSLWPGAQLAVTVDVSDIFPNCPRYLPTLEPVGRSEYVDALGVAPLEPAWKSKSDLADAVHVRSAY